MTPEQAAILDCLDWGPQTAEQVAKSLNIAATPIGTRLRRLRQAGIVAHAGKARGSRRVLWAITESHTASALLTTQNRQLRELLLLEQRKVARLSGRPERVPAAAK
jgi:biotin operon repressor